MALKLSKHEWEHAEGIGTLRDNLASSHARIAELEAALAPFGFSYMTECVDAGGWTSTVHRESISTWFGPSDFRAAAAAMGKR